jgi:RNA polymerase sigma factor (sigma-70 family)
MSDVLSSGARTSASPAEGGRQHSVASPCGAEELAFEQLYLEIAPLLRALARQRFGVPSADVGSLVNDVFVTFLRVNERVHDPRRYLVGATCNAARAYWRQQGAQQKVVSGHEMQSVEDVTFESIARSHAVSQVLGKLRTGCRDILRRYYLDEQTTDDIAVDMGTSPGAIRVRLHKCRESARKIYDTITSLWKPHAS